MRLHELVLPEGCCPVLASLDKHGTVNPTTNAEEDEDEQLEEMPVGDIADLE